MTKTDMLVIELMAIQLYLGDGGTLERWYESDDEDRELYRDLVRKADWPRQLYPDES